MKEIILFCYGDSRDASTWSNVPYLMALSFERRGVKVNRVDISPDERVSHVISRLMRLMKMGRGNCYTRSTLFRILTERRIKKAVRKYADADFCVFLNFDFYNRYSQVPSLVFSDWTFKILSERGGFQPMGYEKKFLKWQEEVLNNATLVLPLFSDSVAKMRVDYPHANIVGIDRNVINCLDSETLDENTVITKKLSSNYVLFIGREAYKEGLKILIEAIGRLDRPIELHVIGMSGREIAKAPDFVKFHGFLRKDNPSECRLYYDLLRNARLLVNPTPEWAGYSSIVEGMYYYTPVVVSRFEQFVKEFGDSIDFGFYCDSNSGIKLEDQISRVLDMDDVGYNSLAGNAHKAVSDYTWDNYVSEMIELMENTAAK